LYFYVFNQESESQRANEVNNLRLYTFKIYKPSKVKLLRSKCEQGHNIIIRYKNCKQFSYQYCSWLRVDKTANASTNSERTVCHSGKRFW
jgi:hypothetical protein